MKKAVLFGLLLLPVFATAQLFRENYKDTLIILNWDTTYFYPHKKLFGCGNLFIQMTSDSISGATNVINEIQYACDLNPQWVTQPGGKLVSNGRYAQSMTYEDKVFGADKWRVRSISRGTQKTMIQINYTWKPTVCDLNKL